MAYDPKRLSVLAYANGFTATGSGMSCDEAIADARGKLPPPPEEIVRDMPAARYWVALATAFTVIGWCAYIALRWAVS